MSGLSGSRPTRCRLVVSLVCFARGHVRFDMLLARGPTRFDSELKYETPELVGLRSARGRCQ